MSGSTDELKGKAKRVTGEAAGNDRMKREGQAQEVVGKAKGMFEDIAGKIGKKIDDAKTKQK